MTVVKIGVAMVAMLLVTACVSERDDSTVKGFFQKGRIGDESDAALMKKSAFTGNWDYVATVHGMVYPNDMDICQSIVEGFREKYPEAEYSCAPLN